MPFAFRSPLALLATSALAAAHAQTLAPEFAGSYSYVSFGSAPGVPANYGGLTLKAGDANTLLLGGAANGGAGAIHQVALTRALVEGRMRITGFAGTSSQLSTAPYIDGGLAYAPNGNLLYTGYPTNSIGQVKPGNAAPDLVTTLTTQSSVGSILFAPGSTAASGSLKVLSYNTNVWYTLPYAQNANGLYDFGAPTNNVQLSGGLEGAVYVPAGSALFSQPSVLVSEYGSGNVVAYALDANADPVPASRRVFLSGLSGAEGAFIDPATGDFLFSTFGGGNQVVAVRGFAPVPEPATWAALALGVLIAARRRRA